MVPTMPNGNGGEQLMGLPLREAREVFEREYLLAQISRFGGNAGEIDGRLALLLVDRDLHGDPRALVHLVVERTVVQAVDDAAHAFGGVVLHVAHVGFDHR